MLLDELERESGAQACFQKRKLPAIEACFGASAASRFALSMMHQGSHALYVNVHGPWDMAHG